MRLLLKCAYTEVALTTSTRQGKGSAAGFERSCCLVWYVQYMQQCNGGHCAAVLCEYDEACLSESVPVQMLPTENATAAAMGSK